MKITIPTDILFQELHDEIILLNLNNEQYHGLNEAGARMWQLLNEYGDTERVVAAMQEEYEIDTDTLRRDVENLVNGLAERNLVILEAV